MSKQKSLEQLNQELFKDNIFTKILTYSLSPLWILQTIYVLKKIPRLPQPTDETKGIIKSEGQSKNTKAKDSIKVLIIGESSVSGDGLQSFKQTFGHQFCQFLSKKQEFQSYDINWKIIGKSGYTIKKLSTRFLSQINGKDYDIVILQDSTNDCLRFTNVEEFKQTTKEFIIKLLRENPFLDIYLPNPADFSAFPLPNPLRYILSNRQQLIQKCLQIVAQDINESKEYQGQVIATKDLEFIPDPKMFAVDNFHPSAEGATEWAKKVIEDTNPKLPLKFTSMEQKQRL